jgi:hypothetical protein
MKFWKSLWMCLKGEFRPSFKSCSNCSYMKDRCSASCGNDSGEVCGAWFPKTDDEGDGIYR